MEYTCECCKYSTPYHTNYTKHLNTKKHIKKTESQKENEIHTCKCGKSYAYKSSLSKHKHVCRFIENNAEHLKELCKEGAELISQLKEIKIDTEHNNKILNEEIKKIKEITDFILITMKNFSK